MIARTTLTHWVIFLATGDILVQFSIRIWQVTDPDHVNLFSSTGMSSTFLCCREERNYSAMACAVTSSISDCTVESAALWLFFTSPWNGFPVALSRACCPALSPLLFLQPILLRHGVQFIYLQDRLSHLELWRVLGEFMFFSLGRGMPDGWLLEVFQHTKVILEKRGYRSSSAGHSLFT